MMKFAVVVLLVCGYALAERHVKQHTKDEGDHADPEEDIIEERTDCSQEWGLDYKELKSTSEGGTPENRQIKEFLLCFYNEAGAFVDDKPNEEGLKEFYKELHLTDSESSALIRKCLRERPEDRAWAYYQCEIEDFNDYYEDETRRLIG